VGPSRVTPHWARVALALALLNASLTLVNVWPTPFVRLSGDLSLEVLGACALLVLLHRVVAPRRRAVARVLAGLWVLLTIGRYADVTAQSMWGRPINLYWDVPHLPSVGAMLATVASWGTIAAVVAALVVVPTLLFLPLRWAFGTVIDGAADPRVRRAVLGLGALAVVWGGVQRLDTERVPQWPGVATPVTAVWVAQARQYAFEASGAGVGALGPAPAIDSTFARVQGADVLLLFVESYGSVSWERAAFAEALAPVRATLDEAIRTTGRTVVSTYLDSPTFGGESWLAHISLLSGTEVRDGATNTRLMAQQRDTMVKAFSRGGYRTVAVMPGIRGRWSEGAFYGFDEIFDAGKLAYEGPSFGWWDITDQFALARLDALELAATGRKPVFAVFPTISTHTPFTPAPPYQPDWARVLTPTPHDEADLAAAWAHHTDWLDLSPGYVRAMTYAYQTFAGYLTLRRDRDFVLILVGDHQPPALVSGEGAPWHVPMHVITSRPAVRDALLAQGFRPGLRPERPVTSPMHLALPRLLDAFGSR
jgi:Sulfatase